MEKELVFIVYKGKDGRKIGDYYEVPDSYESADEYADALQHLDKVCGVYRGATNCGPVGPYWER